MADSMLLLKSQLFNLVPFLNAIVIYYGFVRDPHGELSTTVLKCLPIVCLMFYVLLKGFAFTKDYKCSQRILLGLIFSCVGDALLNIDFFPHGMGAFALAQIFYISAFGWRPLKLLIGIPLYLVGAGVVAAVFKKLDAVLAIGLPVYGTLLLTMCWRALARGASHKDFLTVFCAIGSVLFVISDGLIAVNMFITPIPYNRILIMTTYYVAQLSFALSTANERKPTTQLRNVSQPAARASDKVRKRVPTKD